MIEELTPQVLMSSMALIIVTVPILTLLLSVLLIWRYRRAVTRAMAVTGGFHASGAEAQHTELPQSDNPKVEGRTVGPCSRDLYRRAIRAPWHSAMRYGVAWLASALVFAVAAKFVYSFGLGLPGFFVGVWIYAWPAVLALPLMVPTSMRLWIAGVVVYFVGYSLLALWASTITNISEVKFGTVMLPARSSVTPWGMMRVWLAVNGGSTILMLLCFNRWVRAIGPLVLALVTTTITGTWFVYIALFSKQGSDAVVALSVWPPSLRAGLGMMPIRS